MAKAKYLEWLQDPDKHVLLSGWARKGLSDEQIAKNVGISRSTLSEWKRKYPDIADALKKDKEVADVEVENSLYLKCLGQKVSLKKTFKVKNIQYKDGKKVSEKEELQVGEDEIYIPPDTKAIIFWLTNRARDDWKYRPGAEDNRDTDDEGGIVMMAPADMEAVKREIEEYKRNKERDMAAATETGGGDEPGRG